MPPFQRIAVPATRSSATVLKTRRRVVLLVFVGALASGLVALGVALSASQKASNIEVPTEPTRAIAVAEEAGRDFLAARDSRVPAAAEVDVAWSVDPEGNAVDSGFEVSSFSYSGQSTYTIGDQEPILVRLIRFRVVANGTPYNLDVPIGETTGGPTLMDAPALLPAEQGPRSIEALDYDELYSEASGDYPPTVLDAVENWAAVYAEAGRNDNDLRLVTGDQDSSHSYSGLDGWSGEVSEIVSALPVGLAEDSTLREGWIVQARLVLTPPASNGPPLRTTYDLYVVTEGDPANPPVVAWGPAGSAEDLNEFINIS